MANIELLDNKGAAIVGEKLKKAIKSQAFLSFMTGDFSIYAYKEMMQELNKAKFTRLLLNRPVFQGSDDKSFPEKNMQLTLTGSEAEIKYRNELSQVRIARDCANWIRDRVDIRALKKSLSHAALYHVRNRDKTASLVHGTSNFTSDGLGFLFSPQIELNTYIRDATKSMDYLQWFDEIWTSENRVLDIKDKMLEQLDLISKDHTPEFLYFFTLFHIFSEYVEELNGDEIIKSQTGFKETVIWNKLYKFQKDGVLGSIDKLEKHNGCIIADSVGLGKTFEALAVIKYYELRNDRVLVLCPKKLRDNWLVYTQNDKRNSLVEDRFNYDVLNHTDLSRYNGLSGDINLETVNWSNYDLIVIDESHNFRNNAARKDRETRYSRLMNQVIKSGVKTKVLMLSATPVNNRLNDLKNQIAFITEENDHVLQENGIDNISQTLRRAQAVFNKWSDFPDKDKTTDSLTEMLNFDYFKLLDAITIARSRKHIEKYYDISEIGKFPERLKPKNIKADIDELDEFPAIKEVNRLIGRLNMSAYSPLRYVLSEKQEAYSRKYDNQVQGGSVFRQIDREYNLGGLMRVNLLKRMESSIYSFGKTVASLLIRIDDLLSRLGSIDKHVDDSIDINEIDIDDEEIDNMLIGSKVKVLLQDIDPIRWKQDLEADKNYLEKLLIETHKVQAPRDAKLNELKTIISEKISNPINLANKKIVIFTAFSDTANYLYQHLANWIAEEHGLAAALVVGSGGNQTTLENISKDFNSILTYFSPRSKELARSNNEQDKEIDLLIATDCISEGQNLQDCDYLINYDIHWNPVRIIQRFGRIDRIGSINDVIQLVNFWPNMELDEYINLESRVSGRMILSDLSATGDGNVLEDDEKKAMNDLDYRKKQLKQLQEEVVDLEDISGGISITDLTLNDFKMDLVDYLEKNKKEFENVPLGIHAIASKEYLDKEDQVPGIIFCIKQRNTYTEVKETSALFPYYLVYLDMNGDIMMGHQKTKQILDVYRKICHGQTNLFPEFISEFQEETNDMKDMSVYKEHYDKTVEFILGIVEEKGMDSLFSVGNSTLLQDASTSTDDFELISYLIVK